MKTPTLEVYLTPAESVDALRAEAREGLTATPKWLSPKWFYDARGSELFEEITALPEYYPTRTERGLLARYADEIAALTEPEILIELGSGSSEKTRLLLDAMTARGTLRTYVPQDVSVTALEGAAQQVGAEFPGIDVVGVWSVTSPVRCIIYPGVDGARSLFSVELSAISFRQNAPSSSRALQRCSIPVRT